jgi:hypothetical protein
MKDVITDPRIFKSDKAVWGTKRKRNKVEFLKGFLSSLPSCPKTLVAPTKGADKSQTRVQTVEV